MISRLRWRQQLPYDSAYQGDEKTEENDAELFPHGGIMVVLEKMASKMGVAQVKFNAETQRRRDAKKNGVIK